MKIIDAIKNLKGAPVEIPDCDRKDLPEFFKEMGFKVGAEIGVYKGEYSIRFSRLGMKMYLVDSWKAYDEYNEKERNDQARQDFVFDHTKRLFAPYGDTVFLRKFSLDALKDIPDESLDFVYIDAHHDFKHVTEDIYEWTKKVRKGGIVAGHDYANNDFIHVKYVLDNYTKAYKINNWYVVGRDKKIKGEKWEEYRSWFFIKE